MPSTVSWHGQLSPAARWGKPRFAHVGYPGKQKKPRFMKNLDLPGEWSCLATLSHISNYLHADNTIVIHKFHVLRHIIA
jgi:hypothetical protein